MNQITLSLALEIYLLKDDIAFAINEPVENIPETVFLIFEHLNGCYFLLPKMMLKLLLCGYRQSVFSDRKIEAFWKGRICSR
ncbi:hypothetical protein CBF29_11130 [Vagococcus elongatus]|uniref:Uncharacterized protein n=1 Tax=Vagococcus elongatus TaxID=180344 RepID=A0A430AN14_9ENTE|nr:hypothetical protein CBF29_11130 [Vagococcus elongatus]